MKSKETKRAFLDQLKRTPVVQVSCEKTGVSRATVYRWRKENGKFAKEMDEAITEGVALANDLAETQLLNSIRERNMTGIIFWLRNRHEAYKSKLQVEGRLVTTEELTDEQRILIEKALKLVGLNKEEKPNNQPNEGKIIFKRE